MKHLASTILFVVLMSMTCYKALAHHIEATNADGVTIYYRLINNTELAVCYKGETDVHYANEYSGDIVIPEFVEYEGKTYSVTTVFGYAFNGCKINSLTLPKSIRKITGFGNPYYIPTLKVTSDINPEGENYCYIGKLIVLITDLSDFCNRNVLGLFSKIGFKWDYPVTLIDDNGNEIKDFNCPNDVTSIGDKAFYRCSGLTSINLGNSITSIGKEAFYECNGLTSLTIPNSVISIGEGAFGRCDNLTKLNIKCSPTSIGTHVFEDNISEVTFDCKKVTPLICRNKNISNITLTEKVTSIGSGAFYGCSNLATINLPNSLVEIESLAFSGCSLENVKIPNNVISIGDNAFAGCKGLSSVIIGNNVTTIGNDAFSNCWELTSLTIGNSVSSIGNGAFYSCPIQTVTYHCKEIGAWNTTDHTIYFRNLKTAIIGEEVTIIGNKAFSGCECLSSISIPNSVTSIGSSAFYDCKSLVSVDIPNSVSCIGEYAFYGCNSLSSITLGSNITTIETKAFMGCKSLVSVDIPNSVINIGSAAFNSCEGLNSLTIGNSVSNIYSKAFYKCRNLTSLTLGNSVSMIGDEAFYFCGITSISFPQSLKTIGHRAFEETSLTTIEIFAETPPSVAGLTTYYGSDNSDYKSFTKNTFKYATLYVPKGTLKKYKTATGWKDFARIQENPNETGIQSIYNSNEINDIHTLSGAKQQTPSKGINIIKQKDGTMKKVLVK